MPKFPALPASVDRYVREFLNKLVGRSGKAGDRVAMISDFTELGLAKEKGQRLSLPASAVGSVTEILEPVTGVELPDTPQAAEGLSAVGIFGAVILEWEAPAYNGHNHAEVWRSQVDDRSHASLVHEANGSRYSDVTGNTTPYYYWIRHVNSAGQVGGFNALAGTPGQGTAMIRLADLILDSPELSEQPFAVRNIGTEAEPDHVLIFNGYLAVNGPVNISQLQSGELKNGTALTVGQASIELSTASDGYGQIVITGSGGIATNDYLVLKQGRIESFIYSESAGHIRYKEVRRTENGVATNGQQVTIPAYFKSQPTVNLYPRDISVYNANYPNQSQRLEMDHSTVEQHPTIEGAWVFTPYARLLLADGSTTEAHGLNYVGSTASQRWEMTGVNDLKSVTVDGRAASSRHSGSGNTWQNRQVTMTLEYRTGGGSWISGGSSSVNISQFNTHAVQVSKTLTQGTYDIAVTFAASDRSGTFTSGALEYDYTQSNRTGSDFNYEIRSDTTYGTKYQSVEISSPAFSGWEITRIEYQYTLSVQLWVRCRSSTSLGGPWTDKNRPGLARVKVPNGSTLEISETQYNNWQYAEHNNINVTGSISSSFSTKLTPDIELYISRGGYNYDGDWGESAVIKMQVSNITATIYYRKAKPQSSTASNTFYWDSSRYDLGATDVSISNAIIHWTATGE